MEKNDLEDVLNILDKIDSTQLEDKRVPVSFAEFKASKCLNGAEHRVFIGLTGDCWATACVTCGMVSNESDPDIDWENF